MTIDSTTINEFFRVGTKVVCEFANPMQAEDNFEGTIVKVTDEGFKLDDGNGLYFVDLESIEDGVAVFNGGDGAIDVYHV